MSILLPNFSKRTAFDSIEEETKYLYWIYDEDDDIYNLIRRGLPIVSLWFAEEEQQYYFKLDYKGIEQDWWIDEEVDDINTVLSIAEDIIKDFCNDIIYDMDILYNELNTL